MTDPVQQAREALARFDIRAILAHVEALEAKQARLIDPEIVTSVIVNGHEIERMDDGRWLRTPPGYRSWSPELLVWHPTLAEAIRAAREAQP